MDDVLFVLDTLGPSTLSVAASGFPNRQISTSEQHLFKPKKHKVMHIEKSPYPSFKSCSDSSTSTMTTRRSISSCSVGGSIRADADMVSCGHDAPKVF